MWWKDNPELLFNPFVAFVYDIAAWPFVFMARERIASYLKDTPQDTEVLEVGVGTGMVSSYLTQDKRLKVTGIDPSDAMLNIARKRVGDSATILPDRAERLPMASSSFDVVVMCYTLRHINPDKLETAMSEVSRVLRTGGKFIVVDLHLPLMGAFPAGIEPPNPSYTILGPWAVYSVESFIHYAYSQGFSCEDVSYFPLSFAVLLRKV